MHQRGISKRGLRLIMETVKAKCAEGHFVQDLVVKDDDPKDPSKWWTLPGTSVYSELTTKQVIYMLVRQATRPEVYDVPLAECSDVVAPSDVGPPSYFIR